MVEISLRAIFKPMWPWMGCGNLLKSRFYGKNFTLTNFHSRAGLVCWAWGTCQNQHFHGRTSLWLIRSPMGTWLGCEGLVKIKILMVELLLWPIYPHGGLVGVCGTCQNQGFYDFWIFMLVSSSSSRPQPRSHKGAAKLVKVNWFLMRFSCSSVGQVRPRVRPDWSK